jgi:hypothetical protein
VVQDTGDFPVAAAKIAFVASNRQSYRGKTAHNPFKPVFAFYRHSAGRTPNTIFCLTEQNHSYIKKKETLFRFEIR